MWNEQTAKKNLAALIDRYNKLTDLQRAEQTERDVIQHFIAPLLHNVLGWPDDPMLFRYEQHGEAGRPDITFIPERSDMIYLEAKKFGVIKELPRSPKQQMLTALGPEDAPESGMVGDRSPEEQQAINYAYLNGGKWAILTNFEHFRLYDARRDRLIMVFERPKAYLDRFDLLAELSYDAILNDSIDRLAMKTPRPEVDAEYLAFINQSREILARDIQNNPTRNPWSLKSDGALDVLKIREVVQRYLDRLVLIRFAEDHYVIPADTLARMVELVTVNRYAPTLDSMIDTLFANFDKFHNSALFALHLTDSAVFSEGVLIDLVNHLYKARYRSFAADILGNTYEQYLGKRLALDANGDITTADNLETRKKQGSYYTPQVLVRYLVERTLGRTLYGTEDGTPTGKPVEGETRKTAADIADLRVLDPACGSGSFLIAAYEVLKNFYEAEIVRIQGQIDHIITQMSREGRDAIDIRIDTEPLRAGLERLNDYPQIILEQHLYGVDLDPQAAELAVVNLMMRAMERRTAKTDLPLILNQNVKVGNSLVGVMPADPRWEPLAPVLAELRRLRHDLAALKPGQDHTAVQDAIAAAEAHINDALAPETASFTDPDRVRPFHWPAAFPEVFVDDSGAPLGNPGFSVVIGNPPWEILKPDLREFYAQFDDKIEKSNPRHWVDKRIIELDEEDPSRRATYLIKSKDVTELADYARSIGSYNRQGSADPATHKLFTERAIRLSAQGGRTGLIIPSGIYSDLGALELRKLMFEEMRIDSLVGISNVANFFPGVDTRFKISLLVVRKVEPASQFPAAFCIDLRAWQRLGGFSNLVSDPTRWLTFEMADVQRFSPDTLSVMEFQSRLDYAITDKIYADYPLIGHTVENVWNLKFTNEFHMTSDRKLFNTAGVGLPLYEGKMMNQYDAYFSEPQYWVKEEVGAKRLERKTANAYQQPRLAYRDVTSSRNERTILSVVLPPNVFTGNTLIVDTLLSGKEMLYALTMLNSFVLDYVIRFKVSTHVSIFYIKQLPLPRLNPGNPTFDALVSAAARLTCTRPVYAPLWEQVTGTPWTPGSGVTDPDARRALRDQIDARVAHLFGLSWDEFAHILHTFPLVFPPNAVGEARLKALHAAYVTLEN